VAKPRGWLAAVALGVVVIGALVYLLAGSVPRRVTASGVLSSAGGLIEVQSDQTGEVSRLLVSPGQHVAPSTPVAEVVNGQGRSVTVKSGFMGLVLDQLTGPGRQLTPGSPVLTLAAEPGSQPTGVYLFLPQKDAGGVAPGMRVDINVSTAPQAAFGSLLGRVSSVSPAPVSPQELDVLLANDALVQQFIQGGPPVLATVTLNKAKTPTGLSWSAGNGPPYPLQPGAVVSAAIEQGNRKVLDLILGNG